MIQGISIPLSQKMVLKVFTYRHSKAKGQDLENMIQFVKSTLINSLVIDVRDGYGQNMPTRYR